MSSDTWPLPDAGPSGQEPGSLPRRRFLLSGVFLAVVAVGLVGAWLLGGSTDEDLAPDFTVALFDGGSFTLSTHMAEDGRPVVLNLWASWCPPCRTEIPAISAWAAAHPEVYVLGVAVEDQEADAKAFAGEIRPGYDLAIGTDEFRSDYPSFGLPATYVIDSEGRVSNVHNGIVTEATLDDLVATG